MTEPASAADPGCATDPDRPVEAADTPVLSVDGLHRRLGGRVVLDGVSLEVPPGRIVGLLGPNGAGKTTLLRIVFGVLEAERGTVSWAGRPATAAARRSWGYLPQERGLYRDMRVGDHLRWLARLHGLALDAAARRVSSLLERLGLADRSGDDIKRLSGGLAQRVQLAAAMVHGPQLLALDEPFAGLDPAGVAFLSRLALDHVAAGGNLLLSSHQLDVVEDLCDDIVLVQRGRVVLQGRLDELKRSSTARFLRVDGEVDPAWLDGRGRHRRAPGAGRGCV
ncbi:MAG: ATP-binding cassette domain-containing protein [Acidimicrobiales bacterium]